MSDDEDDGESTFLVVYNPYPRCGSGWTNDTKQEILSWLAHFIPPKSLMALYTRKKPSDVVVVEIERKLRRNLSAVLGAHEWAQFDPEYQYSDSVSRIFLHRQQNFEEAIRKPAWDAGAYWPDSVRPHHKLGGKPYPKPKYCTLEFMNPGAPKYAREMDLPKELPPVPLHPAFRDPRLKGRQLLPPRTVVEDPYLAPNPRIEPEVPSNSVPPERASSERPDQSTSAGPSHADPRSGPSYTPTLDTSPSQLKSAFSESIPTQSNTVRSNSQHIEDIIENTSRYDTERPSYSHAGPSQPARRAESPSSYSTTPGPSARPEEARPESPSRSSAPPGVRGNWLEKLEDEEDEAAVKLKVEESEEDLLLEGSVEFKREPSEEKPLREGTAEVKIEQIKIEQLEEDLHEGTLDPVPGALSVADEMEALLRESMSELTQAESSKRKREEPEQTDLKRTRWGL